MRIFRTLILLGAAGLFLPSPPEELSVTPEESASDPSAFEVMSSAGAAASDAVSFCSRQPDVCGVAGYLAGRLEQKVLYSASLLWGWAWEEKPSDAADAFPATSVSVEGDIPEPPPPGAAIEGRSTLRLDDLIPEWRGPAPQKDG